MQYTNINDGFLKGEFQMTGLTIKSMGKSIYQVFVGSGCKFIDDLCMMRAAALTYTTLLAIVPLAVSSFLVVNALPMFKKSSDQIQFWIQSNFLINSTQDVGHYFSVFTQQAVHLSVLQFSMLFVTALLMIYNIEQAFNAIWKVKKQRSGGRIILAYWGVLTALPIAAVIVLAVLSSVLGVIETHSGSGVFTFWFNKFLSEACVYLAFTLLYYAVPNRKVPFVSAAKAAIVAMILFKLARYGFGVYTSHFFTYQRLYGALATIPIFLVWIYLIWLIVLYGAEISCVLSKD